jgi:hypothetical protein
LIKTQKNRGTPGKGPTVYELATLCQNYSCGHTSLLETGHHQPLNN